MSFVLDFDNKNEIIYCHSKINFENGSETGLRKVNWTIFNNISFFLLENAFKKEELNLKEGDKLIITINLNTTEKDYTKLKNKRFYLFYIKYFLNSNNQIENKTIFLNPVYSLEKEIELSFKNRAYQIYRYKKVSNIIYNGTMKKSFSDIIDYGNERIFPDENAYKLPGFLIIIEDTKELRILEVVPEITWYKLFFMMLGSISIIINIFVVICCLIKKKRVHSSQIETSNRDNLPNNEFNNNDDGIITELNNQNA